MIHNNTFFKNVFRHFQNIAYAGHPARPLVDGFLCQRSGLRAPSFGMFGGALQPGSGADLRKK